MQPIANAVIFVILCVAFPWVSAQQSDCTAIEINKCQRPLAERFQSKAFVIASDKKQLRASCAEFKTMMDCMDDFMSRCVPLEKQEHFTHMTSGLRSFLVDLCKENSQLAEQYLSHAVCMEGARSQLDTCVGKALEPLTKGPPAGQAPSEDFRTILCCGVEQMSKCTEEVYSSACGADAGKMGKRIISSMIKPIVQDICADKDFATCNSANVLHQPLIAILVSLAAILWVSLRH